MPTMPTPTELLDEAVELGLDVKLEEVDLAVLRDDLAVLRVLSDPVVAYAVECMNDGGPLRKPDTRIVEKATLDKVRADLSKFESRLGPIEERIAELAAKGGD